MNTPLVSVIVPVYNVEKTLARCLESICGQSYQNLEIIVVNDGSPDGSLAICELVPCLLSLLALLVCIICSLLHVDCID